ncbi:MAG: hypothetical protein EOM83_01210 [Clostridia bacterium]|nr:hypothetical protein [Clostridia bacterium]
MDDLLYFLLIIGWLAFSFYQQGVKKKRKQEELEAARRRALTEDEEADNRQEAYDGSAMETVPTNRRRDFAEELERMLTGEAQSLEEIPEYEGQSLESIPEMAQMTEVPENEETNIYQKYYDAKLAPVSAQQGMPDRMEDRREELQQEINQEMQLVDVAEEPVYGTSWFDLRKAVIYSEILNRRYS